MTVSFVHHPLIVPGRLELRKYQTAVVDHALKENLMVVMPTGLGKTAIALRTMAQFLASHPSTRALMMAPTRPLVEQHARTIGATMRLSPPLVLTGTLPPSRRYPKEIPPVVVATPQVIWNDLKSSHLSLDSFSVVVFDEAHRATGDYPYVMIGQRLKGTPARILGITASPGSRIERVKEVMEHLGIAPSGVEFRGESDPDVAPYLHHIGFESVTVERPKEVELAGKIFRKARDREVAALATYYPALSGQEGVTRAMLLEAGESLGLEIIQHRQSGDKVPPRLWQAQKHQAVAMKVAHAIELLETQGVPSLLLYLDRMAAKGRKFSPSTRAFLTDPDVEAALEMLRATPSDHPKIAKVIELVRGVLSGTKEAFPAEPSLMELSKVIVFAHYRDMAEMLVQRLANLNDPAIRPVRFVGQASRGEADKGLTQKQQAALLDKFRLGEVNCLVATSVAEEGLDIPATDMVIFYEPVPSEIRTIQRRGRTGRSRAGRVVVLVTQGTQDVGFYYSARGKERRMKGLIEQLRGTHSPPRKVYLRQQSTLDSFPSEGTGDL